MADFKKGFLYLGMAAALGFGVGRATVRTGESRTKGKAQDGLLARKSGATRKKKIQVKPTSHQAPAITRLEDSSTSANDATERPLNAMSDSPSSVEAGQNSDSDFSESPGGAATKKAPEEANSGAKGVSNKLAETDEAPPKVRLFNAYRTRTFWTSGPIMKDTQKFTVFIEREEGKNPAFKPRIDWRVGKSQGTIWGDITKKVQMLTLPPEAWHFDRPTVEVEIKVGAAQAGQDFVGVTETATLTIKSLSQALSTKGGLIHVSESSRQANAGPGWVTSWNKISPGAGTISIYVAPGTSPASLWPMLVSAADFKVEPGVMPQGPMEIFVSRDKVLMGIVAGKIPPQTRNLIQRNPDMLLTYRGHPQDYLGALQWDATSLAARVKTNAVGDTVILFRNVPGQPFGAVKRDLVTIPNIELLRKEGIALFTKPVDNIAYFAH